MTTSNPTAAAEAACTHGGSFDPPPTFDRAEVEKLLTREVCDLLDDPPPSAAGCEGDYRRHLAWWLKFTKPQFEEEVLRTQFAADLLWDLEHDRQSLIKRLPPFLIPSHPHVAPPQPPRDRRREELIQSIRDLLKAAAAKASGGGTEINDNQQKETSI